MVMEAEKFQDLQSASWRPQKRQGFSSNPKARKDVPAQGSQAGGLPLTCGRVSLFIPFGPSTDWMALFGCACWCFCIAGISNSRSGV